MHENIDKVVNDDIIIFARDVSMRVKQINLFVEELMQKLPFAFNAAGFAAEREGFADAMEIVNFIIDGCNQRAKVFRSSPL